MMSYRRWTLMGLLIALVVVPCPGEFRRVCYMANWSQYRAGDAQFTVNSISDVSLCTHIVLAFAYINTTDNTLTTTEPNDDIPQGTYQQLVKLRDSNPGLKVLLAVGGWNHGSDPFVEVVSDAKRTDTFADNVVGYIRRINFDGVDIDWEWPAQRGSSASDKQRFTSLIQSLREKIVAENRQTGRPELILTIAAGASQYIVDAGYEVNKLSRLVDFLSVMTYDMDFSRGSRLLHHSPLYSRPGDPQEEKRYSVDYTVNYWLNKGAPRDKLVVGLPFYGRYYRLLSPLLTDLYDRANGSSSTYPYYQICQFAKTAGWARHWDNVSKVPAIYSSDTWIGFDDIQSMEYKATYIREERLGGAMIWEMGQDDFSGRFCNQGAYPLLTKIKEVLTASKDDCEPGTYGSASESGCIPCSEGSYQPKRRMTLCELCGPGNTTYIIGAKAQYRCVDTCPVGHEYNYLEKRCMKCPLGFTRSQLSSAYCLKCPAGYTTMKAGDSTCVSLPEGVHAPVMLYLMYHFTLTFTATTCENRDVIVGAISAAVRGVLSDASTTWSAICSRGCENIKTVRVEGCAGRRKKRDARLSKLTVWALIEEVPEILTSAPDDAGLTMTRTTDSIMVELFFDKDIFSALSVYGIQYNGMTERTVEKLCRQTGYVFSRGDCVPCSPGTYKQTTTRRCIVCPKGTYQNKEAQTECIGCPVTMTTVITGADSVQQCLSPCAVDTNYCDNHGVCEWRAESLKVFCKCEESYYGERCDKRADAPSGDLVPAIGGIVGGLGSVMLVILVMVICCVCNRRRTYSQKGSISSEPDNVFYVPSVMTHDYLPTPTAIAAHPYYYYDDSFVITDKPRTRGVISEDTFRTPTVIQRDTDAPSTTGDRKTSAPDRSHDANVTNDTNVKETNGNEQSGDNKTEIHTVTATLEAESDDNGQKPIVPDNDDMVLGQRL